MKLQFLDCDRHPNRFCSIEPITTAALIGGGSQLIGSGLSFLGGSSAAKNSREAMERYLNELRSQRQTFLDQGESKAIRKKLEGYIGGDVGYNPDVVKGMRSGVIEDYGKSLGDMTRLTKVGGAGSSGVYTPGRADRTSRLLGQNIASNRGEISIRSIGHILTSLWAASLLSQLLDLALSRCHDCPDQKPRSE